MAQLLSHLPEGLVTRDSWGVNMSSHCKVIIVVFPNFINCCVTVKNLDHDYAMYDPPLVTQEPVTYESCLFLSTSPKIRRRTFPDPAHFLHSWVLLRVRQNHVAK